MQIFKEILVDFDMAHDNGISTPTNFKTRTSIKFNLFPEIYYKSVKFNVFTLQLYKLRENYSRILMHGVIKVKRISVGKTNIGTKQRGRTLQMTC